MIYVINSDVLRRICIAYSISTVTYMSFQFIRINLVVVTDILAKSLVRKVRVIPFIKVILSPSLISFNLYDEYVCTHARIRITNAPLTSKISFTVGINNTKPHRPNYTTFSDYCVCK